MRVLVTGAAGFIGYSLITRLLARGDEVIGVDVVNAYYDPALKEARLARLTEQGKGNFTFLRTDFAGAAQVGREYALAPAACGVGKLAFRAVHIGTACHAVILPDRLINFQQRYTQALDPLRVDRYFVLFKVSSPGIHLHYPRDT